MAVLVELLVMNRIEDGFLKDKFNKDCFFGFHL